MNVLLIWFVCSLLFLLGLTLSSLEKAIMVTNQFLFKHTYEPTSRLYRLAHAVIDSGSESLKISWFGKTFFLIILSFLLAMQLSEWDFAFTLNAKVVAVIVFVLVFVEVFPKLIGETYADTIIIYTSPVLLSLKPLFKLFLAIVNSISVGFSFVLRSDKTLDTVFMKQDLRDIISQSKLEGKPLEKDLEIIANLFEIRNITAREIMVPRKGIHALSKRNSMAEVRQMFKEAQNSKLIVYNETIDDVLGYVDLNDMFKQPRRLSEITKEVFFIPESRKLFDILQDFLKHKDQPLAVVVDEYGGTVGIISLADLTKEITGDIIKDVGERRKRISSVEEWKQVSDNVFEVSAKLKTEALIDIANVDITGEDYETVGGFVLNMLQRIPEAGEEFVFEGVKFTMIKAGKSQIETIKLEK